MSSTTSLWTASNGNSTVTIQFYKADHKESGCREQVQRGLDQNGLLTRLLLWCFHGSQNDYSCESSRSIRDGFYKPLLDVEVSALGLLQAQTKSKAELFSSGLTMGQIWDPGIPVYSCRLRSLPLRGYCIVLSFCLRPCESIKVAHDYNNTWYKRWLFTLKVEHTALERSSDWSYCVRVNPSMGLDILGCLMSLKVALPCLQFSVDTVQGWIIDYITPVCAGNAKPLNRPFLLTAINMGLQIWLVKDRNMQS